MKQNESVKTPETINGAAKETGMQVVDTQTTELSTSKSEASGMIESYDMTKDLPNLNEFQAVPLDLMSGYWTPKIAGELKRVFFDCIEEVQYTNEDTGETKSLVCAFFYEGTDVGTPKAKVTRISNGSKRLVGMIQGKKLNQGAALQITYLGKKKNVNNSFSSDDWSVFPLKQPIKIR